MSESPSVQDRAGMNQERLNFALESARMGTWDWEIEARSMQWDDRMHALFGIPAGTFRGSYEAFLNLLHPDDRRRVAGEIGTAIATRSEYDGEFRVVWPSDGTMHVIRLRFCVPVDAQGKANHLIAVAWDVTKRRETEETLARERHLFRTLMDHLPDSIYFKDLQSRFMVVNRAKLLRSGVSDEKELIGKSDSDFFSKEPAEQALADEQRILRTGEPIIGVEEKLTWPDGHETWASTTKMPLRDQHGKLIGTFGLSRDITLRKRAQQLMEKLALELRAKNELLEQDLEMARELQAALLPHRSLHFPRSATPEQSAVHFHHFYNPSMRVSGDFYDVLEISGTKAGIFICDVMGHGVRAALVAAIVRAVIGELKPLCSDPDQFLTQLNRSLRITLEHAGIPLFVTAFYVVVDLELAELRYSNAGHPCPVCIHHSANSEPPTPLNGIKPGPALGLFDNAVYRNGSCKLSPHDVVLLFTDGLFEVESASGEPYDYRQLISAVSKRINLTTTELCRQVVEEVQQFSGSKEFTDDVCLVAVEVDHLLRREPDAGGIK